MWKNDNFFIGFLAGLLLTLFTAALIIFAGPLIYNIFSENQPENKLLLLAFIPGVLLMRWYMKKMKFSKAGSGVLVVIFLSIILYFVLIDGKPFSIFVF
ncbi:MAG: hypothetical protein K0B15_07555 [Lentimicrobium sp.]|nr:hypothetical protein [Lentimicrobium sp.]